MSLRDPALLTRRLLASTALGFGLALAASPKAAAQGPPGAPPPPQDAPAGATLQLPELRVQDRPLAPESEYKADQPTLPKLTQPLRDTPQSITVVPRQVMDDQNVTTLRDTLRNVTGLTIAAGEASAQGDSLTIRGFTARNDLYLDGMRDFGSYYRDPFNYDRIEVLKGPSSILFGRGSTGGVVNQASKTPLLDDRFVAGTFSLGTDNTHRLTLDANAPVGAPGSDAAVRLNLMAHESDVADRDVAHNQRFGIAPTVAFGIGTPTRVTVSYFHLSEDDTPDYGFPWLDFGPASTGISRPAEVAHANYYGFQNGNFLKAGVDIGTAKVEHDVTDWLTLRDQMRFAYYTRYARITEPQVNSLLAPGTLLSTVAVTRNQITTKSVESFYQNQFDGTARFATGAVEHVAVAGFEVGRESSEPTRTTYTGVPTTNLMFPSPGDTFAGSAAISTRSGTTAETFAFYLLDTLKLGPQWELTAGMRWDHFDAGFSQNVPTVTRFNRTDEMPSWRAALVYKPTPIGSVYVAAGDSFNPSAEALTITNATNLPPETSQSYEVGTKWDLLDQNLSLRGALFQIEKQNARVPDPTNTNFSILGGDQRSRGFEIETTGRITPAWQIIAGYAHLDTEVVKSTRPAEVGNPLANAPEHQVNAWTTYTTPWAPLQVGGGINYVASRNASTFPDAQGKLRSVPEYWTLNVMAKYTITEQIALQLNAYNLLDTFYFDQLHPNHVIPGPGRTIFASTAFKF
jgi:catecholate siderophore receptor